jgi:hypothetical protein
MHLPIAFRMLKVENLVKLTPWGLLLSAQGLLLPARRPRSSFRISC